MDNITNIEELPEKVWQELKTNAENMVRNSKISFWQGTKLLELATAKIKEAKADDDEPLDLEKNIKEVLSE